MAATKPKARSHQYDPEESKEEAAARRIDVASEHFAERCEKFVKTLQANRRDLTPYKRQMTTGWLKRHCERLQTVLAEGEEIPPLGLSDLPEFDD